MLRGEIVVVGLGQSLRRDDGAGLAAVEAWREAYPDNAIAQGVRVELAELPGLALIDLLLGSGAAILVDAVRSGAPPGKLHILTESELEAFAAGSASAHGLGVAETLALGRRLYPHQMPPKIVLIGIEGASFEPGPSLSPMVKTILPDAVRAIQSEFEQIS